MITSVHNPKIQTVRKLQSSVKARREERAFIIEGVRLAEEALKSGWEAQLALYTDQLDERGKATVDGFLNLDVPAEQVSESVMNTISETETPQGMLVVLTQRTLPLPSAFDFLLVLDGVRDPGNLGTIFRTAVAAGVQAVLLAPGCVDAWSPKVVRSGMGAHFHLPIHNPDWQEIRTVLKQPLTGLRVYLADSKGGISYSSVDFRAPLAFIIGGEAAGAGAEAESLADLKVHIPMPGGAESLNAAVAASILLFEAVRQRTY